ncbi:MAG: hypothetical protein HQ503_02275 [Rhodospirillales bacterium]|nr:hypothetical protein [Rhodospirillales bacterium]
MPSLAKRRPTTAGPPLGLHLSFDFDRAGLLPSTGFKHGKWVDSVHMQRVLGGGDTTPPSR